ncbi:MAG: hypothetical protein O2812_00990 [Chloroflexi bacterium]|nr:hypothetical protein [Chloroflexota bacterium]
MLFQAIALSETGSYIQGVDLRWRVTDPLAGTMQSNGIIIAGDTHGVYSNVIEVQARRLGGTEARVIATASIAVLSAEDILADGVRAIIAPESIVGLPGEEKQFLAFVYDRQGVRVPIDRTIWRASDPNVGAFADDGVFTMGNAPGLHLDAIQAIVVLGGEFSGATVPATATVVIRSADDVTRTPIEGQRSIITPDIIRLRQGDTQQATFLNFDLDGNRLEATDVQWTAQSGVAMVDSRGRITAIGEPGVYPGAVQVLVRDEFTGNGPPRQATATLVVLGQLSRVEITPASVTMKPGGSLLFLASAYDAAGFQLFDVSFTWDLQDSGAGRLTTSGLLSASDNPGDYPAAIRVRAVQRVR